MQDHQHDVRAQILKVADRLFYEQGIRAIGVNAIAAEAGISKKTLYQHFSSKDDLVVAYLRGRFRPVPEASSKPPAQQILANLEWIARSLAGAEVSWLRLSMPSRNSVARTPRRRNRRQLQGKPRSVS
jgi:AcrR family transcriptional regulator